MWSISPFAYFIFETVERLWIKFGVGGNGGGYNKSFNDNLIMVRVCEPRLWFAQNSEFISSVKSSA